MRPSLGIVSTLALAPCLVSGLPASGALPPLELQLGQIIKTGTITQSDPSKFTFVDVPQVLGAPCDMDTGPDGSVYVDFLFSEKIARIDPDTKKIVEQFDIPFTGSPLPNTSLPIVGNVALGACVVRTGNDGNIYAANGIRNQLVKLDTKTKKVSVFNPPNALSELGNLQPFNDLWAAPEGMYYGQTTANLICLFDYQTTMSQCWNIPTPASLPLGMALGDDKLLYFTELAGQKIGSLNHTSGEIKEYPLPVPALLGPAVLRVRTEGRYVWFTGALSDSIGRFDTITGEFKAYPNDAPLSYVGVPSEITKDGDGMIWFDTWTQNLLHKLDPNTGKMEHFTIPGSAPNLVYAVDGFGVGIHYFEQRNQIYFTQATANNIGIYQL